MIQDEFIDFTIAKQKRIALIAHDGKKDDLLHWVQKHENVLKSHFLSGTGTTARILSEETDLPIRAYNSGPLGGDQQIGARIVEGNIDMVIFFWDPLEAQPHDPDIRALLRIAAVYDVPLATSRATADFLIESHLMDKEYTRKVINYNRTIAKRLDSFIKDE